MMIYKPDFAKALYLKVLTGFGVLLLTAAGCKSPAGPPASSPAEQAWVELFNGKDLQGWTPKVVGYPAGEDPFNLFRVEEGLLKVRYNEDRTFEGAFGHLFYETEFSHYLLEVEYRFVGQQVAGGPDWAWRNNGIMYHAQAPSEMALNQSFPDSLEFQLLGGRGTGHRPTANLCTPGTRVVMAGELREEHCIESSSATYSGDGWVRVQLLVRGSEFAEHQVEDQVVMQYSDLQREDGTPLSSGVIALQAETHPIDFRSIRLLNLAPTR